MQHEETIKTTLNFRPLFHRKLKTWAQANNLSMSEVVERELTPVLTSKQEEQHRRIFDGLYALSGMVEKGNADASATIDDFLYGKPGEGLQTEECG